MYVQESLEELCRCTTAPVFFFFLLLLLISFVLNGADAPRDKSWHSLLSLCSSLECHVLFFFIALHFFFFFLLCGLPPCVFFFSFSSAPHSISPSSFLLLPFFLLLCFFSWMLQSTDFFFWSLCAWAFVCLCACVLVVPKEMGTWEEGAAYSPFTPPLFPFFFAFNQL